MSGVLDMGNEFSPFPGKMGSSSEEVPGSAHVGGIHIGHWHHAASEEGCYLIGVDLVVFGLAAMNGFHVECMAKDKGDLLISAEISNPVLGEDALNGNDNVLTIGSNGLQKDIRVCLDVTVQEDLSLLIEDAEIHCSCMQIDTAVKLVLMGVKSHVRPPWDKVLGSLNHTCFGYGSRGP